MREFSRSINNLLTKILDNRIIKERLLLVSLISILTVIWFRKGLILGSGESGLPFYNTSRLLELLKNNWTDVPLGGGGSIGFPGYPLYAAVTFFQQLNIPSYVLQAVLYWMVFVVGTLAIFEIASLIKGNSSLSRISSSLFYIFNPIAHISVLHRFQYPLIFFYGFIPLAFLIYIKGLKSKNFIYLIILSLVSIVFSYAFVGPAFIELFFGVLALLTAAIFLSTFKNNRDYFPIIYFLAFIILFTLVNSWWLAPLFASVSVDLGIRGSAKFFNPSNNVDSFKGISDQIQSVLSVFRLFKPNDYNRGESSWGWIYSTAPFVFLSFFSAFAFIISLFRKEKEFLFKFFIFLAFITMFWMKGSLPPFGGVTLRIFEWFTFLHVFRNPFEKIGMLLPFVMAIPVGFGTAMIINGLSRKLKWPKKFVAFLILIIFFPFYMFPIITGLAFTGGGPPANDMNIGQYVKVPDYYKDAREWLDKQKGLFRVLVLPIDGEGMTYKWEYGFSGVELSNNLFNHPMVSLNTSQGDLPEMVGSIKEIMSNYPAKLWVLAQLLNVRYIMVRDDIDYLARETESPDNILNIINEHLLKQFSPVAEFGKLKFFELNPTLFAPKVFTATQGVYLSNPSGNSLNLIPFSDPKGDEIYINPSALPVEDPNIAFADTSTISGIKIENLKINVSNPVESLPYVSIYRDAPFYALVRLKEEIESQIQTEDTQLAFNVNLMGKRLKEASYSPKESTSLEEYFQGYKSLINELTSSKSVDRAIIEKLINQKEVLEELVGKTNEPEKMDQMIAGYNSMFVDLGVKSVYPTEKNLIRRFYVQKDSLYEVIVAKEKWDNYFEATGIEEIDLDGKTIKFDLSQQAGNKDYFLLGRYRLNKGIHEVGLAQTKAKNLIAEKLPEELVLSSKDKKPLTKIIPIGQLDNNFSYSLSFEYLEEKGNIPVIAIHSDVDFIDKNGEKIPRFGIALTRDNYDFGWKKYTGTFTPFPASGNNYISIKIIPFGDCKATVARPYRRYCEDNSFNQRFLQDSSSRIRNIKVERQFLNPIILREVEATSSNKIPPKIDFEAISPARYKVKVSGAQNPFFLVLSTAFDPRWSAYFTTPQNIRDNPLLPKNHLAVNGYANGWYIDKLGSYEMFLEYSPENMFVIANIFSLVVIIIFIIILIVYSVRRYTKSVRKAEGL